MLRILTVVFCVATVYGGVLVPSNFDDRIIGGEETTIEEYPYQIALRHFSINICGGTIINKRTVVTAAHCTYEKSAQYLSIRAGSTSNKDGGQIVQVARIIPHEKYNRVNQDYDICILQLESDIEFNESAAPVKMQDAGEEVPAGTEAVITGWGRTIEGNSSSGVENLRKVEVNVISIDDCRAKYNRPVTDRMLCCTSDKKDSCQGDSGGPLVADGKLIGVVSWGQGCANPRYAGVYSKLSELRPWVEAHID